DRHAARLGCRGRQRKGNRYIALQRIGQVRREAGLAELMDMFEPVAEARAIVDVEQGRWPVGAGFGVQDRNRLAAGGEMDLPAADMKIVLAVAAVHGEFTPG